MKRESNITPIIKGTILSVVISVFLSALCAMLITQELIPEKMIHIAPPMITMLSVLIGCLVSAKASKKILTFLTIAGAYFFITALAKLAFFAGKYDLWWKNIILAAAAASSAALSCARKKKPNRSRRIAGR